MIIKDAFKTIKRKDLPSKEGKINGLTYLENLLSLGVGKGSNVLRSDESGLWLGAAKFADAPFRVDMNGNMYFESDGGTVVIDAVNKRIVIYDANDVPRVLIGYQLNGF